MILKPYPNVIVHIKIGVYNIACPWLETVRAIWSGKKDLDLHCVNTARYVNSPAL